MHPDQFSSDSFEGFNRNDLGQPSDYIENSGLVNLVIDEGIQHIGLNNLRGIKPLRAIDSGIRGNEYEREERNRQADPQTSRHFDPLKCLFQYGEMPFILGQR